ncbi:hypothetical protein Micbo1qcDRAFT_8179 [Microdochium bolleyi]|uniref:Zn(2)-C6 fungal-type domain-containing protein n=1 Tax=Microdochium bolleyi TaxID=196109 RepID=A0A136JK30_9PEZI|nr:hypothetical protein Micbo1qcDRAFT_8179 [Microdochium bolleyi]
MSAVDDGLDGAPSGDSLACVACRNRKLKCDRTKPACTRCVKLKVDCLYPESRRKPTFKRRNVKELEARLAQVEDLLREAGNGKISADQLDDSDTTVEQVEIDLEYAQLPATEDVFLQGLDYNPGAGLDATGGFSTASVPLPSGPTQAAPGDPDLGRDTAFGELMGLGGLSEALPPFEVMEELHRIFFTRQQHFIPILHPARYLQSFYSAPHMKPPMCLQYAVWALASNGDLKYHKFHDVFYQRARRYLEADEMKGHGEHFITLAHAQAWCLVATDEARSMLFTRAAMSSARATQLSYMMGLHRLDCGPEDTSPTLAPPKDWAELEERRRTFWGVFCIDSHCSISTGWPHLIDVAETVTTRLPASETAFHSGEPVDSPVLSEALRGTPYSSFAGAVIICYLFDTVNRHVHRGKPSDNPHNYEYGAFWTRHREIDNILSSAFMFLPACFRLPDNNRDPTAIHTNLNLHAAVICLHHGAIDQVAKCNLPEEVRKVSEDRLCCAAQEIVNIAKLTSHINNKMKSPLAALSLYCAASVYIYLAKTRREAVQADNLDFLLAAMDAISREHAITGGFLRQTVLDIRRNDVANIIRLSRFDALSAKLGTILPNSIPMLARSQISRHSECAPPLPGRLPLGNPVGRISTRNVCKDDDDAPVTHGFVPVADKTDNQADRQANANRPAGTGIKRRRVSPSSTPGNSDDQPTPLTSTTQSWNTNSNHVSGTASPLGQGNFVTSDRQLPIYYSMPDRPDSMIPGPEQQQPFLPGAPISGLAAQMNAQEQTRLPHRVSSPHSGSYSNVNVTQGNNMPIATPAPAPRAMPLQAGATTMSPEDMYRNMRPIGYNDDAGRGGGVGAHGIPTPSGNGTDRTWAMHQDAFNPGSMSGNPWDNMGVAMDNPDLDWDVLAASLGIEHGDSSNGLLRSGGGASRIAAADIVGDVGHVP